MDNHGWQWQTFQEKPVLICRLLAAWPHGFFTREFYPQPPADLVTELAATATAYRVKQVHGDCILTPTEIATTESTPDSSYPPADAVLSDAPNQSAWVASADCTPVLIGDCQTGQVAAIHAGWRGTAARIVPKAIARFQASGSKLADLRIALGPAISGDVYQFDPPIALKVGQSLSKIQQLGDPEQQWQALQALPDSPIQADSEPEKCRLDVRRILTLQLAELDIASDQWAVAPHCTFQEPELFFSYRRTHTKEVQWSGIVSQTFSLCNNNACPG